MAAIETHGLALLPRERRPEHVLADLTLKVEDGSRVGLLGGNGAGKSTLIKVLLGLQPIGEGRAELFGVPVPQPQSRVGVGYLPEQAAPFEHLTGREHLRLFGRLEGLSGAELERRVETALCTSGLTAVADLVTLRYSKGMKQKLELSRIAMTEKRLLLLDEPLTGLDIESQMALENRLAALGDEGVTMVITSHETRVLERICTHFAVLRRGRLIRFGRRDEILGRRGWVIELEPAAPLPVEPPPGATLDAVHHRLVFDDRDTAERVLAGYLDGSRVARFGTLLQGVEDVLREVVAS